jgi:hypothetical protein
VTARADLIYKACNVDIGGGYPLAATPGTSGPESGWWWVGFGSAE